MLPDDLTFERWERTGRDLARALDSTAWCLGDWIIHGEAHYADRYRRAIADVGLNYQTLRNYAWVARRFDVSRRRDGLSFQHHMELARLRPMDQELWLDRSVAGGWSVSRLRRELKGAGPPGTGEIARGAVLAKVAASEQRVERWRAAASQANSTFENWVVANLDLAASRALDEPTDRVEHETGLPIADSGDAHTWPRG